MTATTPSQFSDYIVFVDETGDHGMTGINRDFPLFGLAFCVFAKHNYITHATTALRRLKFDTFGHDMVVLHEHDIRKKENAFANMSREPREQFLSALTEVIAATAFTLTGGRIRVEAVSRQKRRATGKSQWPFAERVVPFQSHRISTACSTD